jgi:hypothetical protein
VQRHRWKVRGLVSVHLSCLLVGITHLEELICLHLSVFLGAGSALFEFGLRNRVRLGLWPFAFAADLWDNQLLCSSFSSYLFAMSTAFSAFCLFACGFNCRFYLFLLLQLRSVGQMLAFQVEFIRPWENSNFIVLNFASVPAKFLESLLSRFLHLVESPTDQVLLVRLGHFTDCNELPTSHANFYCGAKCPVLFDCSHESNKLLKLFATYINPLLISRLFLDWRWLRRLFDGN